MKLSFLKKISTFQMIIAAFILAALIGALILTFPIASRSGERTPFGDALFTSTSAICVTGLVVRDTATYWSGFGQAVILFLIQLGGLGVVTFALSFFLIAGKRMSLKQRMVFTDAVNAPEIDSLPSLVRVILTVTGITEGAGFLLLLYPMIRDFGARGIWMAFFHSISAYCNAGFDLLGTEGAKYVSLTGYANSPYVLTVVMLLIIAGGLGFLTWNDLRTKGLHLRKYRLQSKLILTVTVILIFLPALLFFFTEYAGAPFGERLLSSLFQSVTTRTAGFNSRDFAEMTPAGQGVSIILMLVGAAPGSTAGGMKVTTLAVIVANAFAAARQKDSPEAFGRRIPDASVRGAFAILSIYLFTFLAGGFTISLIEGLPAAVCLFETASAVGTVGLSMGLTPTLGAASHAILIVLMFLGRVGGLTLFCAAFTPGNPRAAKYPQENVMVG